MKIIISIILVFSFFGAAYPQWIQQWAPSGNGYANAIFFIDSLKGWAVGGENIPQQALILHTTNNGKIWETQLTDSSNYLQAVSFVDSETGWVVGYSGIILHTTNAGKDWAEQANLFKGSAINFYSVSFVDRQRGYIVGDSGTILQTENGGISWTIQLSGFISPFPFKEVTFKAVTFIDTNIGWVVGYGIYPGYVFPSRAGIILHTSNGGKSWVDQNNEGINYLSSVCFIDSNIGFAGGAKDNDFNTADGWVLRTTNGGLTWNFSDLGYNEGVACMSCSNSKSCWTGGRGINHSVDGGVTWKQESILTNDDVSGIFFTDANNGWAASGGIFHTFNGGTNIVDYLKSKSILQLNNYPNPFNGVTIFNYNIPEKSFVALHIKNLLGEEIARLVDNNVEEGAHEVKWDAQNYSAGIYFCQLRANEYSVTIPILVMK